MTVASLSDPIGVDPFLGATQWVESAMLGTIATAVAVIAVALVGVLMLNGRIDWRRGARVIAGCFVLFGATEIAAGIHGRDSAEQPTHLGTLIPPTIVTEKGPTVMSPAFDPYAGASVSRR